MRDEPFLLRAALRERRALADRLANAFLIGFGAGAVFAILMWLSVGELVR